MSCIYFEIKRLEKLYVAVTPSDGQGRPVEFSDEDISDEDIIHLKKYISDVFKVEISNIKKISKEDYELMSSDTNKVLYGRA